MEICSRGVGTQHFGRIFGQVTLLDTAHVENKFMEICLFFEAIVLEVQASRTTNREGSLVGTFMCMAYTKATAPIGFCWAM